MLGSHGVYDDLRRPQCSPTEQLLQGVDHGGVATPVGVERLHRVGQVAGLQIGEDVSAPEGIDGLFGVTDQHQGGVATEGPVDHLPLHWVGVLKLVDQHDFPTLAHALGSASPAITQGVGELRQQVVEAQDPKLAFAAFHLSPDRLCEGLARLSEIGVVTDHQGRLRVGDHCPAQRLGVREAQDRLLLRRKLGQIKVTDHFLGELVEIFHEGGIAISVTSNTQGAQHCLAEGVRGGDGRGIKVGHRLCHSDPAGSQLRLIDGYQRLEQVITADRGRVGKGKLGFTELAPHSLTELLGRRATKGDHQQLRQPHDPLDHISGDQGRDGVGLAGACARLEDRRTHGQRAQQIKLFVVTHLTIAALSIGCHKSTA